MKNFIYISFCLLLFGCFSDLIELDKNSSTTTAQKVPDIKKGEKMILGEKLEDPFTVENMQKAFVTLQNIDYKGNNMAIKKVIDSINTRVDADGFLQGSVAGADKTALKATHIYVRYQPTSKDHLQILDSLATRKDWFVKPYPAGYKILQIGKSYKDPATKNPKFPVSYGTIPVGDAPPNVPFQKIKELYLSDKKLLASLLEGISRKLTGNISAADLEAFKAFQKKKQKVQTASFFPLTATAPVAWGWWDDFLDWLIDERYTPRGTIWVANTTDSSAKVPYKYAKMECHNWWYYYDYATTNSAGEYSFEKYRWGVSVNATWNNSTGIFRNGLYEYMGFYVSTHMVNLGKDYNNRQKIIYNDIDRVSWVKATVHLGILRFNAFLDSHGISHPGYLNYWIDPNDDETSGVALMWKHFSYMMTASAYSGWRGSLLHLFGVTKDIFILDTIAGHLFPDVCLNYKKNLNTVEDIERLLFHELAHTIHAKKAGWTFWVNFSRGIFGTGDPSPYGDGTTPTRYKAGIIAFAEGWAEFIENKAMHYHYDNKYYYETPIENFKMIMPPYNDLQAKDGRYISDNYIGWSMAGLLHDITDTNQDIVKRYQGYKISKGDNNLNYSFTNQKDELYISLSDVWSCMTSSVYRREELRQELIQQIANKTVTEFYLDRDCLEQGYHDYIWCLRTKEKYVHSDTKRATLSTQINNLFKLYGNAH